jgi:hypothetical protein
VPLPPNVILVFKGIKDSLELNAIPKDEIKAKVKEKLNTNLEPV